MITASDVYYMKSKVNTINKKLDAVYRDMFMKGFDGTDGPAQEAVDAVDRMMKDAQILIAALDRYDKQLRKREVK